MKIVFLVLILAMLPISSFASTASDFTVNRQSTYDIPYGTERILILDLTLPEPPVGETYQLESISLHNAGTADHTVITKLEIWEDGKFLGWNNDETEAARILKAPFFDTQIFGNFKAYSKNDPWRRLFITVDLTSEFINEKTFNLQLLKNSVVFTNSVVNGPADIEVAGFERTILRDAPIPSVPMTPLAQSGKALSESVVRWYFIDLSNNEFGFKILDANLKEVAKKEEADLSYLDETGLKPNTEYSGRRIVAFNDRGENSISVSSVFPSARTLALVPTPIPVVAPIATSTEIVIEEPKQEVVPVPTLFETIQTKIADIQRQINNLLKQINELIKQSSATVFGALQGFLQAFFGK